MCLAVPGKVVSISENPLGMAMGTVSFGGIMKEVCLAYVPEVKVGDYVLIHVGFALSRLDEKEAGEIFRMLKEMGDLEELDPPPALDGTSSGRHD